MHMWEQKYPIIHIIYYIRYSLKNLKYIYIFNFCSWYGYYQLKLYIFKKIYIFEKNVYTKFLGPRECVKLFQGTLIFQTIRLGCQSTREALFWRVQNIDKIWDLIDVDMTRIKCLTLSLLFFNEYFR